MLFNIKENTLAWAAHEMIYMRITSVTAQSLYELHLPLSTLPLRPQNTRAKRTTAASCVDQVISLSHV